ncbi:carboxypeptidase regulatory-like domain-containing protein [Silvibacterium acidisoli]|uniref:carboxypeptidase regulatory-like domain-containing protein n=1 Tax=Acidobacteriaceae bacterium ZG23-2 TaxID=2883246 RepID=UPI00406D2A0D
MLARWRLSFALSLGLMFLAPFAAHPQSDNASISGTVSDTAGAVLPRATVTIRNEATNEIRTTTTNDAGTYNVTNLSPGSYTIRVEAQGFQTYVQSHAHLDPSIGSRIDASLKVGSSSETVNVVANANTIQTQTASVGQLVTQQQVQSIQLNGRNPMYLAQLEPGVRRGSAISNFNFGLDNGININGSNSRENGMTFDGAPMVRSRGNGTSVGVADTDSTSEMQVLTASYPAEYGRASGGIIRIVPKSGTSDFHGAVFEYLRNSFLNANTWARNLVTDDPSISGHPPAFRFNQFGWNFNGPVWFPKTGFNASKKKLFFLAGQEWIRYRHVDTDQRRVPTALMRTGNFSELLDPSNIFYGKAVQLTDPTTGAAYPNNVIPSGELSANGLALLNAYPAPNANNPSYNWIDAAIYPENQRKDTLVVDYIPFDSHHLRFSLLNYNYNSVSPHYGNFNRTPQVWSRPNQVAVAHWTWTISPTMVNEAYASASADHVSIGIDTSSGLFNRTNYGINYPYLFPGSDKEIPDKIPTIQIANIDTLDGGPYPSHSGGVVWDYSDSITKIIGNHTIKAGFLYERESQNDFDQINVSSTTPGATNNQNGFFVFTDTRGGSHPTTGAGLGNAALGLFDTYGEIGIRAYTIYLANMYEYFAQDTWRARPNLVIEYGIRHSIMMPFYARWGNLSVFSPSTYDANTAPTVNPTTGFVTGSNLYDGIVIPGSGFPSAANGHVPADILNGQYSGLFHGFDRGYNPTVWTNLQPRIGFTLQLDPQTVLRAGVGRYFDRVGVSDSVHLGGNPPFQPSATVSYGSVDNPGGVGTNNYPINMTSYAYHFPSPEAWSWTLTAEHEFNGIGVFTLGYVGRRGLHLQHLENINQLQPGTTYANAGITADALRPYQGFSVIQQQTNDGISIYHSLQANLRRRVARGFIFGIAYTWSKSMDTTSDAGDNIPNFYDPKEFYGPSDYDTRNSLVINYVWDVTFADHSSYWAMRNVLGRWQLSGTTQFQSGTPQSVTTGDDWAGVGPGSGNQFWDKTGPVHVYKKFSNNGSNSNLWFNSNIFVRPADGTFAPRESRNQVFGPGFQSWNIALQKSFPVIPALENHRLIFKAEAYNFLNHPNLDNPDVTPTDSNFGKVTQKGNTYASDRQMQFSLRYQF